MRQGLQDKLKARYPELLKNLDGDASSTPLAAWGIECPDGWYRLLDMLCRTVSKEAAWINEKHPELGFKVAAEQIKEKFGTMRFYYSLDLHSDQSFQELPLELKARTDMVMFTIRGAVSLAENLTEKVCVGCGMLTDEKSSSAFPYAQCQQCADVRAKRQGYALNRLSELDEELGLYNPPADKDNEKE